jgi:hypothetical protein
MKENKGGKKKEKGSTRKGRKKSGGRGMSVDGRGARRNQGMY